MPFSLLYTIFLDDDEFYPYWIGVSGHLDPDPRDTPQWSQAIAAEEGWEYGQKHKPLEQWCMDFAKRGYHFEVEHDAFNGSHQVYKFIIRTDAMRFLLQNIMTDKRITT